MDKETFDAEYVTTSDDETEYDVTFELSKEAEDMLFASLGNLLREDVRMGVFSPEAVRFYKTMADERTQCPPWLDDGGKRTYNVSLTDNQYTCLTRIIGDQLKSVLSIDGTSNCEELVAVWQSITEQIDNQDNDESNKTLDEFADGIEDPENGHFACFIYDNTVAVFENDFGDTWYKCTSCDTMYADIGDEHGCLNE